MSDSKTPTAGEKTDGPLTLAVMSDLHVRENDRGRYRDLFAEISRHADVLAVCGDLTDLGLAEEATVLASELEACAIPVVGVLGNHDYHSGCAGEVKQILSPRFHFLEDHPFEAGGVGFAGVKGFAGGFERRMLGAFGEEMMKAFVNEVVAEAHRLEHHLATLQADREVVVLHYAPVSGTVEGEPLEIWPFLGSSRLAETIDRFDVAAVFHGHAHPGAFEGRTPKGIPVFNCSYEVMRKRDPEKPYLLYEV